MLLNCFICLYTVSRTRKWYSLLCQSDSAKRSGSRLAWEDLSFSAEEGLTGLNTHLQAVSHLRRAEIHSTTVLFSHRLLATNLIRAPLSSTDYFQNLQGLLSENQRNDRTSERKLPSPQDLRHRSGLMPSETLFLRFSTGVLLKLPKAWCPSREGME